MNQFMKIALDEARKAFEKDEVPVGAVVVCGGEVLSMAHNLRESSNDPTAHAEILAIKEAVKKRDNWRFDGCDIYVTKEPCPMCAGAIQQARFDRLIFGCKDEKGGYAGSLHNTVSDERLPHRAEVVGGVEEEQCRKMLQDFFKGKRNSTKSL